MPLYNRVRRGRSHVGAILYTLLAAVNKLSGTTCTDKSVYETTVQYIWLKKTIKLLLGGKRWQSSRAASADRPLFARQVGVPVRP